MKNSFFSKILVLIFLFTNFSIDAQVRIRGNNLKVNKKRVIQSDKSNKYKPKRVVNKPKRAVMAKPNAQRIVLKKPTRPNRVIKRPNYKRSGYVWAEGHWIWNSFYGKYIWKQAGWKKIKKNHYWIPGFWQITLGGFIWVQGYWQLDY